MVPSKYQTAIYKAFQLTNRNLNISAVAGSGKTTTLLELIKFVPRDAACSFFAFNKSIVGELTDRNTRPGTDIMTIHSCGWRAILRRYGGKIKMNPNKALAKTEKVLKKYENEMGDKKKSWFFYIIPKVVDLMRCNLLENVSESYDFLMEYHDLMIDEIEKKVAMEVFREMNRDKREFDFMDMIYQPVIDPLIRLKKYDYVFCDESQDFSVCQQEFIKKCLGRKGRLITVGDRRQAIYGFAGADADSYDKLASLVGISVKMPLSVSYRCARKIVEEAQAIVPEISASPFAEEGEVKWGSLTELEQGDWIICRNLKPLIEAYLWLMKNKIKSKIRGKEIGEGILALINKVGGKTLDQLDKNLAKEVDKLNGKLAKRGVAQPMLHPKMILLLQKLEVIECLVAEVQTVEGLKDLLRNIFSDEVKGILLTTIHKAKGLENDNIFFLAPELIPSKFATQPWQIEQENNLKYVGITRAKKKLVYVSGGRFSEDLMGNIVLTK